VKPVEPLSKSALDRLGSRLRNDPSPSDEDLLLLNRYREQFLDLTRSIVRSLQNLTSWPIESRHKSVPSIVAKLRRRQPARLTAIQDIAGARIIVSTLAEQDGVVRRILSHFPNAAVDDKRPHPTLGYRAVHVIVTAPLPFEIQIRTAIQHDWAQLSERLADRYGFELKYGGGPERVRLALIEYSEWLAAVEQFLENDARAGNPSESVLNIALGEGLSADALDALGLI
jgi:putative GTP pyrophosphokinase